METTKIAANIKASVLRLAVNSQWCERTLSWEQATTSYTRRPRHLDYQTYVKHRCIYIAHVVRLPRVVQRTNQDKFDLSVILTQL